MIILGIWDGHDAGAALLRDGEILFAANEERFSRKKLDVEFPRLSIREALKFAGLRPADIDGVAVSTSDFAKTLTRVVPAFKRKYYLIRRRKLEPSVLNRISKRMKYALTEIRPNPLSRRVHSWGDGRGKQSLEQIDRRSETRTWDFLPKLTRSISSRVIKKELGKLGFSNCRLVWVEHHLAHAAAAVATSPYERGLFLSLDGIGDGLSGMIGTFEGSRLRVLNRFTGKNSLGLFFEHVTNLLNMRELEDEGKVMALAGFGYPVPDEANPLLKLFEVEGLELRSKYHSWKLHEKLARVHYFYPAEQFAYLAQRVLEVNIVKLVQNACRATGMADVAYAGGVASNIKVNQLLKNSEDVRSLHVFPHMGDGGLALGAAIHAGWTLEGRSRTPLRDLFLGPEYAAAEIEAAVKESGLPHRKPASISDAAAELIAQGHIVLWFQGRMEYGPRALGGRSILALANSVVLKNKLNVFLKKRVWYQPFCPTILEGDAAELLRDHKGVNNAFMTVGYSVKDQYADRLAAVINTDNSCRPQILEEGPERFRRLLERLKERIGIGAVLNTSMNKHGESIVNTPSEALDLLLRGRFEYLAIGDFLVWKS